MAQIAVQPFHLALKERLAHNQRLLKEILNVLIVEFPNKIMDFGSLCLLDESESDGTSMLTSGGSPLDESSCNGWPMCVDWKKYWSNWSIGWLNCCCC